MIKNTLESFPRCFFLAARSGIEGGPTSKNQLK